jgi:hypothetical protein
LAFLHFLAIATRSSRFTLIQPPVFTHTHTKVFQSVFQLSGIEKAEERSSNNVVSVKALGGNCSGTRGDTETANPGPDRDITKGAQRDKTAGESPGGTSL